MNSKKKRSAWRKAGRIALKTILSVILLVLLVVLSLHLPFVQRMVRKKVISYLEKKLDTKVSIGSIHIELPEKVVLKDVYIEDRNKDTLLAGGTIKTNINLWKLTFKQEVEIESISLENITAKIKREHLDTVFNYQFIVDAFAPENSGSSTDTSSAAISLGKIKLDKIRLLYTDAVTGNTINAFLDHLDTRVDVFDATKMIFDIPTTNIKGLTAAIYQVSPLANPKPFMKDSMEAAKPVAIQLAFKKANLEDVHIDYRNEVAGLYTKADIGSLELEPGNTDLVNQFISFDKIALKNSVIAVRMAKNKPASIVAKQAVQQAQSLLALGWNIHISTLSLTNNSIQFNDENFSPQKTGMDYAHLHATNLSVTAENIILNDDTAYGRITNASFTEKSGFELQKLAAVFSYTATGASLDELFLKTPGSEIRRKAAIKYASPQALVNDMGNMEVDIDLAGSKVLVMDVLTFVPSLKTTPAFAYPAATWYVDGRITGRIAALQIDELKLEGLRDTKINISGSLTGLPDINKLQANLLISNLSSSKRDIQLFIPPGSLPSNITLPERFNTNGQLKSSNGEIAANLRLNTDLGNAAIKGTFRKIADAKNAEYKVTVNTSNMNVGTIIQNKEIAGPVSASFTINGIGYDPKMAVIKAEGIIHSSVIHQYKYTNINVKAALANQQATIHAAMKDPNIDFSLDGTLDLTAAFPAVKIKGMIDSIKLQPLHFASQDIIFRGKIDADLPVTDPDNLQGTINLTEALFVNNNQRLKLDTVQIEAGGTGSAQFIRLKSDIMTAAVEGKYKLSQMPGILQQAIQPYFAIAPSAAVLVTDPYDFELNAYIADNPALKTFVPGLQRMDSVIFRSHFSDSAWTATLHAAAIEMNGNNIQNLQVQAGTTNKQLAITASVGQFKSGSMLLNNTSVTASAANNTINFAVSSKDKTNREKYHIKGLLEQPQLNNYALSLLPDSLILNYERWTVTTNNRIIIAPGNIQATNFTLGKNGQQLTINSLSSGINAPLQVDFNDFRLSTITGFIQTDSTIANGTINGKLLLTDISKPLFNGDLTISDFSYQGDTVGNVHAIVNNKEPGIYHTDISLTGRGNDVKITGNYMTAGNNNLDLNLVINTLPLQTIQAFSNDKIRGASGTVNGKFAVSGNFQQPVVNGGLTFNKAAFNFSMLNSYFTIDQETVVVSETGFRFSRFEIKDSASNPLIIDGLVGTHNFINYTFDLDVRANNFKALNSTKKDNRLYYGQLYFNTNLKIKGTESAPQVDGRLVINDKTKMTVVLPQAEPGIVERDGIIVFVDKDAPFSDSLFLAAGYDSLNNSGFTGMDIAVNISVVKEAEFNIIIDEGNGDFLNVKGEAALTAGIDPSGKITLTGTYELEQGSYELTFNFLKRKFNIEKGSRIAWQGEPTDATLDIKAVYLANAAPLDLVKDQLGEVSSFTRNTYLQKLPFDVHLNMEGKLMQPQITFDIVLPENKNYAVGGDIITNVRTRLDQLRQETGEMNKQVFSLLLLNRFIAENPFNSSGGGPTAGTLARQSVSKLLTEQLNKLAGDLIAGVDINFDVLSSEDYTSGERRDRTDLNVGLSKRLLNDRLTITVGSNFELEGPQQSGQQASNIAGNLAIDYRLSKDNRYLLRAYRKNEYQGVIEGYIIETGVGFIINLDYNRFREIFISKKEREQRKIRRQEQQKINEAEKTKTLATDSIPVSK